MTLAERIAYHSARAREAVNLAADPLVRSFGDGAEGSLLDLLAYQHAREAATIGRMRGAGR